MARSHVRLAIRSATVFAVTKSGQQGATNTLQGKSTFSVEFKIERKPVEKQRAVK